MMRSRIGFGLIVAALVALFALPPPARAGVVSCTTLTQDMIIQTYLVTGTCTMSSSYATGGDTFTAANTLADVGAKLCGSFARKPVVVLLEAAKTGNLFEFDHVNRKIMAFRPSAAITPAGTLTVTGGQAAGAALQILPDANAGVLGKQTATTFTGITGFVGTAVGAAAGVQVTAAVNLSATTLRYVAFCQ
jgi:hypothetical protein